MKAHSLSGGWVFFVCEIKLGRLAKANRPKKIV